MSASPRKKWTAASSSPAQLLLEIGTEELPYRVIRPALHALDQAAQQLLKDHRLTHGPIRTMGTPRRLVLLVEDIPRHQAASVKERLGPPAATAFEATGHPTQAARGFAASQGVPVQGLEIRTTPKGQYVCAVTREAGLPTSRVLAEILPGLVENLTFPKTMRWNESGIRFSRPVRWILALFGSRALSFEAAGVNAGGTTWGHRFMGKQDRRGRGGISVSTPGEYVKVLEARGVIPDYERRKNVIVSQLASLGTRAKGQAEQDEDLVEQAVFSVEYPNAILGRFNPDFLTLPDDILKTAMKEHQGFFPLTDTQGILLPRFISVTNMQVADMGLIRTGNERVLAARLADAKFFFEEDRKVTLAGRRRLLQTMTYHHKLGTLQQKTDRVVALVESVARMMGHHELRETLTRAASLCKTDLLTGMVGEFPMLQGMMGGEYAKLEGESEEVSTAIHDHYLPKAMEGALPPTLPGKILSLADRLDTIVAFFQVGMAPTGSQDPFGLRRQASALVRIVVEGQLRLDLSTIVDQARELVQSQGFSAPSAPAEGRTSRTPDPVGFIEDRLRFYGRTLHGIRDDVMDAILHADATKRSLDLIDAFSRMIALQHTTTRPEFEPLMIGFKRAFRLTEKEQWDSNGVNAACFQHPAETALHDRLSEAQRDLPHSLDQGSSQAGLDILVGLKPVIDGFFNGVLVNAEDPSLRANRLSLLAAVKDLFLSFADFSHIQLPQD